MYKHKKNKNQEQEQDSQRETHPRTVQPNNSQGTQKLNTMEAKVENIGNSTTSNKQKLSSQIKRNKTNKQIKRAYPDEIEMRYQMSTVSKSDPPTPTKIFTTVPQPDPTPELTTYGGIKLGWVQGVLIPCLLNIWGVMLFLRIAWIVAQAGISCSILIIFMSAVVCIITTLSLSAICTNGQLQGGGVYYLVSRSLGAELGASVGIIFAFANAVAASMNTIGFCESFNELLKSHNVKIIDNSVNDIRIVGAIALLVMCLICAVGMDWETRTQNFLIVIIVTAIINYIIGSLMGPMSNRVKAQGFQGLSLELASTNWAPDFRITDGQEHGFFSVFAMYFPAVTGVQAGANICGDLRDPATAIPKGTLLAVAISTTSYVIMAVMCGMGALRDASGNITLANNLGALSDCKPNCQYGLHNNYEIMHLMALWGPLIYGGCWAATLSTALTNLLSVPRLIQALGIDHIYPGLIFFSKPYGKHGEPYRGYVLVFLVSLLFLLIADLNTIAPLITNFYLASYALINFCTFHAAFFKPITWRPGFRYFNLWLSLVGCLLCITIMIIISWMMALITTFIFLFLYLVVLYRQPETSWEGSTNAQRYQDTIAKILQIYHRNAKTSSYNPQLLVLAGEPQAREWLLDMGKLITSVGSFMIVADIESKKISPKERHRRIDMAAEWLHNHKLRAFYLLIHSFNYEQGIMALLQSSGLGRLAPNIMLIGYKYNWREVSHEDVASYFHSLQLAFQFDMAVAVLRVPRVSRALRSSISKEHTDLESKEAPPTQARLLSIMPEDSDTEFNLSSDKLDEREPLTKSSQPTVDTATQALGEVVTFKRCIFPANSTLDAWWLYDDGGMNILLPYIIARRSSKDKMSLRLFILPKTGVSLDDSYNCMKNLLAKFRIDYSKLTLVDGINTEPSQSTLDLFKSFTSNMTEEDKDIERMLLVKTTRHLRLRELMMEHSFGADLIVMTLPYPRNFLSPILYMAWLEIMSKDLPPLMFVRGNHTSVIEP